MICSRDNFSGRLIACLAVLALLVASVLLLHGNLAAQDRSASRAALAEAKAALGQNDPREARIVLLNAIKDDPNFGDTRILQAKVLLQLGDGQSAEAELRKAIDLRADPAAVRALLTHAILMQGEPERALEAAKAGPVEEAERGYLGRIMGAAYLATGNLDAARREFDFAVSRIPKDSELWIDITRFRRINQDRPGAFDAINLAIELQPKNAAALTLKAEMVREAEGLVPSIPFFQAALAADPKFVPALLEYAATLGDAGRNQDMLVQLRKAFDLTRNVPRGYYLQAVLAARAGDYALARALLQRTRGKMDSVPGFMLMTAIVELQMGNAQLSARWSEKLMAAQPDNLQARQLFALATFMDEDYDDALAAIGPIVDRRDADVWSLMLAARSIERLPEEDQTEDRWKAREDVLNRAFAFTKGAVAALPSQNSAGSDARATINQVRALLAAENNGAALSRAQGLQAQAANVPDAHMLVGDAALAAGNYEVAGRAFEKAAELRNDEAIALRLALTNLMVKNPAAAENVARNFLRANPESVAMTRVLANLLIDKGDWQGARLYLDQVIAQTKARDAIALRQLGRVWLELRDPRNAYPYLLRSYRLMPANSETSSLLGLAILQRGDNPKAAVDLQEKAVAMMPDNRFYRERLAAAQAAVKSSK